MIDFLSANTLLSLNYVKINRCLTYSFKYLSYLKKNLVEAADFKK